MLLKPSYPYEFTGDIDVKILLAPILAKHVNTYNIFLKILENIIIKFLTNNEFIKNNVELTDNNYLKKDLYPIPKPDEMYTPDELKRLAPTVITTPHHGKKSDIVILPPNSPFQCTILYNQAGMAHLFRIQSRLPSGTEIRGGQVETTFETLLDISTNVQDNTNGWDSMRYSVSIDAPKGAVLVRQPQFLLENINVMTASNGVRYGAQQNKQTKLPTRRTELQKMFPPSFPSKTNIEGFAHHFQRSAKRKRTSSLQGRRSSLQTRRSSLKRRRTLRSRKRFRA